MSSSDRRQFLALLAVAPLAACGFTPVYGPGGTGSAVRGPCRHRRTRTTRWPSPWSRLEDRLGRASGGPYLLSYRIETSESALGTGGHGRHQPGQPVGRHRLYRDGTATDVQVQAGRSRPSPPIPSTGSPVATAAARRDAEERLMIALADQIVSRLLAGADAWA
jgi:LPS-assembly lipoprotein